MKKKQNDIIEPTDADLNEIENEEPIEEVSTLGVDDNVKAYLKSIGKVDLLTREEELKYTRLYRDTGDINIKKKIVEHNLRLVVGIAKRFVKDGRPLLDLIQEGNIGLMTAVDHYNPDMGYRFSTYATWWIRQAISRYIANNDRMIRIPVHVNDKIYRYNRFLSVYKSKNVGNEPTKDMIMEYLDITEPVFNDMIRYNTDIKSLDDIVGDENDKSPAALGDFLSSDNDIEKEIDSILLKDSLERALSSLTDKERNVIILRFGLDGKTALTLEQVGKIYNVTRERARQIELKALRKLRNPKRLRELREFL